MYIMRAFFVLTSLSNQQEAYWFSWVFSLALFREFSKELQWIRDLLQDFPNKVFQYKNHSRILLCLGFVQQFFIHFLSLRLKQGLFFGPSLIFILWRLVFRAKKDLFGTCSIISTINQFNSFQNFICGVRLGIRSKN